MRRAFGFGILAGAIAPCRCPPWAFLPDLDRRGQPRGPFFLKFTAGWEMQTRIGPSDGVEKSRGHVWKLSNIELRAGNRKGIPVALRLRALDMIGSGGVLVGAGG